MNNITFQANFIKAVNIQKRDDKDNYHPYRVSIVEIDKYNSKDMNALNSVSSSWGRNNYVSDIYYELESSCLSNLDANRTHVFAITSQREDFENLRADDVMCVSEFVENKEMNELQYIEVNPEHGYANFYSEFKYIGSAMLQFLTERFPQKYIKVFSSKNAEPFYKKNNYSPMPNSKEDRYYWNG